MTGRGGAALSALPELQGALAGEHAVVYAYGVAGAWLAGETAGRAGAGLDAHRAAREVLEGLVRDRDREPVAALAGYALPGPVDGVATAQGLLALVEGRLALRYADLVAAGAPAGADAAVRAAGLTGLVAAARAAVAWGAGPEPFPGLGDPPPAG